MLAMSVPDEGYSRNSVHNTFDIYVFIKVQYVAIMPYTHATHIATILFIHKRFCSISTLTTDFKSTVRVIMFNATFNNILTLSRRSVLLVEETGVPRENHFIVNFAVYVTV